MTRFESFDGTELAYRRIGEGAPLLVIPGGPGRAGEYLGDLGGLSRDRTLYILDNRGTGGSAVPADGDHRAATLAADVEAFRAHLGLDRIDLLGHSAGGGVVQLYAAAHPDRLRRVVLAGSSFMVSGVPGGVARDRVMAERAAEPWYSEATAALAEVQRAEPFQETEAQRMAMAPLLYGRWDAVAREHAASDSRQRSAEATEGMYAGLAEPRGVVKRLGELSAPVLLLAGEHDIVLTRFAAADAVGLFPAGELAVMPGGGHFMWLDDPEWFRSTVVEFLSRD
ncbi:pimeloyl-ACP methyl ester carboxylesterase [Stackebrandtia albiflava]|uniref:Pimeloyl-ACP methyl ester carboxylesterase n=1 Tax=Stackebrandtia albiflava TaxID=406432 RepID=A0A562V9F5_9ACTN|nr:alpha/beta hydrolase [Stackebrandtia albiflava]TWJ14516.1 pimeloyl-ACP methyl ester carboxylesterase [Stackebrandtia albiflava]